MTQCEEILDFLRGQGGVATLGQLIEKGRYSFSHELRARISDLRRKGFRIICEKGDIPSHNKYSLLEERKDNYPEPKYHYDEYGVGAFNF